MRQRTSYFLSRSDLLYESSLIVKTEFDKVMGFLRALKSIRQILDSLCMDVMAEIATLTARIMPAVLHLGLDNIPNELLARILTMDSCNSNRWERQEELMLVNKRFRDIVSSTPECWSQVRDSNSRRNIFKNAPIDLQLTHSTTAEDIEYYEGRIRRLEVNNHEFSLEDVGVEHGKYHPSNRSFCIATTKEIF